MPEIPLLWKSPPLRQNDRQHHMVKAKAFAQALSDAQFCVRVWMTATQAEPLVGANVTLHYRAPDRKRRDSDGLAPTLKAVLDALVSEGMLPDDSWVCVPRAACEIHPPSDDGPAMWVTLEEAA